MAGDYVRTWHYLRGNKRSATPTNFAFLATESHVNESPNTTGKRVHTISKWHATGLRYSGGKWTRRAELSGDSALSFWRWLYSRLDPKRPLWLWGHNISRHLQLLSFGYEIERGVLEWETKDYALSSSGSDKGQVVWQGAVILDDPPTVIELKHVASGCKLWILDTLNFWRCTHDDFILAFNGQQSTDTVVSGISSDSGCESKTEANAVQTSVTSLVATIRKRDLGNLRWTAAAQGLQCFRHRFMRHKILVHCDEGSLKLERDSYFGGNVSIYRYGEVKGPIYVVDVQSFYPSIMESRDVPTRWLGFTGVPQNLQDLEWCSDCWRIARVTVNSPSITFPVRHRGHLVMAAGRFITCLHEPEFKRAIDAGCIERVHALSWYTKGVIFKDFVREIWSYRREAIAAGNLVEADLYKLLLNGVPGKLGQRQVNWVDEPKRHASHAWGTQPDIDADTGEVIHLRFLNWRVQRRRLRGEPAQIQDSVDAAVSDYNLPDPFCSPAYNDESKHSIPQIAGAITSWGRVILEQLLEIAGRENVYYTDTDCLHVSQAGYDRLTSGGFVKANTLGALVEKTVAGSACYRGIKYYSLDGRWVCAGHKDSGTQILNDQWEQEQFTGWSSLLYDGTCGHVESYMVKCSRGQEFIPGEIQDDGRVTPIRLFCAADAQ